MTVHKRFVCPFLFLIIFATFLSSMDARKLLTVHHSINKEDVMSLDDKLYFSELPKGRVPASAPSKKGHAVTIDEKLIAGHLAAIDRILRSVPSPGVGH